jgi:hypothetical protein
MRGMDRSVTEQRETVTVAEDGKTGGRNKAEKDRLGKQIRYGVTGGEERVAMSGGNGLPGDSSSQRMLRTHQREPS